jgi:ssDNA-binding replication factor A large subunit
METIKVRDLIEPTCNNMLTIVVKVKDILPGKSGYNLYLKVVKKDVLIDIVRLDKTRVVIADFLVGDETGTIKMRLRNGKK